MPCKALRKEERAREAKAKAARDELWEKNKALRERMIAAGAPKHICHGWPPMKVRKASPPPRARGRP